MKTPEPALEKAIEDVAFIRRMMSEKKSNQNPTIGWSLGTTETQIVIQAIAFFLALALVIAEACGVGLLQNDLLLSSGNKPFQSLLIFQSALILLNLVLVMYILVFRAAKVSGQIFSETLLTNFHALNRLSFAEDLLIKFSVFSLLILADKPEWTFPLFLLFTGDYCIQGRFFTLPLRTGLLLGITCLISAFAQFYLEIWNIYWPFLGFLCVCGLSLWNLIQHRLALKNTVGG